MNEEKHAEEAVEKLSYAQFAKMYETSWVGDRQEDHGSLATKDKFNFVMVGDDESDNEDENKVTDQDQE